MVKLSRAAQQCSRILILRPLLPRSLCRQQCNDENVVSSGPLLINTHPLNLLGHEEHAHFLFNSTAEHVREARAPQNYQLLPFPALDSC